MHQLDPRHADPRSARTRPAALAAAVLVATAFSLAIAPARAAVHEYRILELPDGTRLPHAVVLPEGFRPDRTYPALLALPPGSQDRGMVEAGLLRYWGKSAARRGWIVVSPVAPAGSSFHSGAERHLPELLHAMNARYRIEGSRFHLAGASNGGRSAYRIARLHPELFHSLVVLPGAPTGGDLHHLDAVARMPVRMFVGGKDGPWVVASRRAEQALRRLGADVRLEVLEGEGHAPPSMEGGRVIEVLEGLRRELGLAGEGANPSARVLSESDAHEAAARLAPEDEDAVSRLLEGFHEAAARADLDAYFEAFAPQGVFLGTDPGERWTVAQFREYARPHFEAGRGWTYVPIRREVVVDPEGRTAWFDESLQGRKYGLMRGTGVARRTPEGWRIVQYSLTFAVPNESADAVVEAIRATAPDEDFVGVLPPGS